MSAGILFIGAISCLLSGLMFRGNMSANLSAALVLLWMGFASV